MARNTIEVGYQTADQTVAMMKDVARHYGRDMTPQALAKKHGVRVGRIQSYATNLRGYGLDVAKMRKAGLIIRAVDELRSEAPELFKNFKGATVTKKKLGRPVGSKNKKS